VKPAWLGAAPDDAGGADSIIDTHVHFYDPTRPQGVPWPSKNDKLLYRQFLPEDFRALTRPQKITGAVVVEASPWLEDNQWVLDIARDDPFVVGLVGHLTPGTDDFRKHLDRFAKNPLFRGIRVLDSQLVKGLEQPAFMDDLKRLAGHDRTLDVNGGPGLLTNVPRLAKLFPELRIVINHAANVANDGKSVNEAWLAGIKEAAPHRNVYCKVSALVEHTGAKDGEAPTALAFYKPLLDALWDAFGADRLMYGSNWPVSGRYASYAAVYGIVAEYFRIKGAAAAPKFFSGNARAAYQWVKR
jgi:L-fuconolactonase